MVGGALGAADDGGGRLEHAVAICADSKEQQETVIGFLDGTGSTYLADWTRC